MKPFLKKIFLYGFIVLALLELGCRLFVDKFYFNAIDVYKSSRQNKCLFIGSSRVPATIDEKVFQENNINCVVAGRGYTTSGIHLTALEYNLSKSPDYLRNATVLIEYPERLVFTEDADKFQYQVFEPKSSEYDAPMPHLILPYLDSKSLKAFMAQSPNSLPVKIKLFFLYYSAAYRCVLFLQEKQLINKVLKKFSTAEKASKKQLASTGGIKNRDFSRTIEKAVKFAKADSARLSKGNLISSANLDNSILAAIAKTVNNNGGRLYMYRVPLHSVQKNITLSERASLNKKTFEAWLQQKDIPIITAGKFTFTNDDFPDTWHLGINRRKEFSTLLINELYAQKVIVPAKPAAHQVAYPLQDN